MEALGLGDFSYESRVVDEARLAAAKSDEPFAQEAFEVNKELGQSLTIVAGIHRLGEDGKSRALTRDEAILAGLMVRCAKLQHGVLQSCSPQRIELLSIFARSITEAAINLRYLAQHGMPKTYDAFVRSSLRVDKQLLEDIQANVAARGGETLPIEDRMLAGIERTFEAAGMTLDDVDAKDRSSWTPNGIFGRFKELGRKDSYLLFSVQSHYVHGNWHDLYAHHLTSSDEGFEVDLAFGAIRPQVLTTTIIVLADSALSYLADVADESEERDILADRIVMCTEKARRIDELHEAFLARSSGETDEGA